jgi:quercetin dioxygenase-like cupin family protein
MRARIICGVIIVALNPLTTMIAPAQSAGEDTHDHRLFPCLEDGLRSNDTGCQLLAKVRVSQFPDAPLFWCLNKFPTRDAAEAAKVRNSLVVEAEGQFWLFSFGPKSAAPKQGELIASTGPLQLTSNTLPKVSLYEIVAYLAVMPPGTYTRVHIHPGPEAWYILSGEQCLETPAGPMRAQAGESMVAPPTTPMRLTNSGSSVRRAFFIVIHDANQPWTIPTEDWKPTGACDRNAN